MTLVTKRKAAKKPPDPVCRRCRKPVKENHLVEDGVPTMHLVCCRLEKLGLRAPSEREMDCLRLWVCGRTNREVATALKISEKTVEAHRANIRRKLSTLGLAELLMKTIVLGLVPMPVFAADGRLELPAEALHGT